MDLSAFDQEDWCLNREKIGLHQQITSELLATTLNHGQKIG